MENIAIKGKIHWKRMQQSAALVSAVTLAASLSACSSSSVAGVDQDCKPQHEFSTVTPGQLTVSTYDFAPHTIPAEGGLSGVEGELLAEVAKRECLTLTVDIAGGASAAIPSVQTGRSDLAAGDWYRTQARAKLVTLSDPLYLDQGALVSKAGYQRIDELSGKKIGSVVGNLWNDDFQKVFGDNFAVYQDAEAVFKDLASGRIDAVIDSVAATTHRFKSAPIDGAKIVPLAPDPRIPDSAKPGQINWPTSKTNPKLGEALNADIKKLHDEGFIADVLKKYGINESAATTGAPYLL